MPEAQQEGKFKLEFIEPYSTFQNGEPKPIPYVVDGLLPQGGFSVMGGKPKFGGKSSFSRKEGVCVASGTAFLGRDVVQGEVILISLEDPRNHLDNCLKVLGYDPQLHARIHILERLPGDVLQSIELLGEALSKMPDVRLVIVDTLAKLLRVTDLNDYMPVLGAVEQLRNLARQFPYLHVQGLVHCKKVQTDDPFDSILGSTALRGEADTNIALYQNAGNRVIATETRIGRSIPPTILHAEIVESAGADVVKTLSLGTPVDEVEEKTESKREEKQRQSREDQITQYLSECTGKTAPQETLLKDIGGNRQRLLDAVENLVTWGAVIKSGTAHSTTDPLKLTYNDGPNNLLGLSRVGKRRMPVLPRSAGEGTQ